MSTIRFILTDFLPFAAHKISSDYRDILMNGCKDYCDRSISFSHFLPYTKFKHVVTSYGEDIVDLSNGDKYWLDDPNTTRLKCLALVAATPIVHAIGLVLNLANRIAKIVSFLHFWHPSLAHLSLSEKSWAFGKDLLRAAFSPIIYVGLELSALYGLISPNNGKKLYATLEHCAYGNAFLAPCFQPSAMRHLGGGIPSKKNEW